MSNKTPHPHPSFQQAPFWAFAAIAASVWSLSSFAHSFSTHALSGDSQSAAEKAAFAVAALILFIWTLLKRPAKDWLPSAYLLLSLAYRAYETLLSQTDGHFNSSYLDSQGVLVLLMAVVFAGDLGTWWTVFFPLLASIFVIPIIVFESHQFLIPALSLAGAAVIALIHETRAQSTNVADRLGELSSRNLTSVQILRGVESDMKSLLSLIRSMKVSQDSPRDVSPRCLEPRLLEEGPQNVQDDLPHPSAAPLDTLATSPVAEQSGDVANGSDAESVSDARLLSAPREISIHYPIQEHQDLIPENELVHPAGIFQMLREVTAEFVERMRLEKNPKERSRLTLSGPTEMQIPVVVRADLRRLRDVIQALLQQGVDASRGGEGIVRVGMRLGLGELSITIEDNGRGLSEAIIEKMTAKGIMQGSSLGRFDFAKTRKLLESFGGRLEMMSRLGVGTRVLLEFPRLDAYSRDHLQQPTTFQKTSSQAGQSV